MLIIISRQGVYGYPMYLDKTYLLVALNMQFVAEAQAFSGINLSKEQLQAADSVDIDVAVQVIENLNRFAENPVWAAQFGQQLGVTSHGPLGYAMVSAATPSVAVETFLTWAKVRFDCYEYNIEQHDKSVEVIVTDTTGSSIFHHTFFQACARAFEVLLTTMLGMSAKSETRIHFNYPYSLNTQQALNTEFESPLVFNADNNKIVFSHSIWTMPSPLYDQHAYAFNLAECRRMLASREEKNREDTTIERALNLHFQQLIHGVKVEQQVPQIDCFAKQLHISERTLTRRLAVYNTCYRDILDKVRQAQAAHLLGETELLVESIAELLGYHESANFCRAFKKWFKCTPSEYRRDLESSDLTVD